MSTNGADPNGAVAGQAPAVRLDHHGNPVPDHYKWIALSNTTLGVLIATINASILLISLPAIFDGIKIDPLQPSNTNYLLWLILGFLVVTAVLVVSLGRLGDIYGRARTFNLGFAVFTFFCIMLSVTWMKGSEGALWLIIMRALPGRRRRDAVRQLQRDHHRRVPGQPARPGPGHQRRRGRGRLLHRPGPGRPARPGRLARRVPGLGPLRRSRHRLGIRKLRDLSERKPAKIDLWGNLTFAMGPIAVMVGITYGIQPYGHHTMGWTSPKVIAEIGGGILMLIVFCFIETRVEQPMFHLDLFKVRAFTPATSPRCCRASAAAASSSS